MSSWERGPHQTVARTKALQRWLKRTHLCWSRTLASPRVMWPRINQALQMELIWSHFWTAKIRPEVNRTQSIRVLNLLISVQEMAVREATKAT